MVIFERSLPPFFFFMYSIFQIPWMEEVVKCQEGGTNFPMISGFLSQGENDFVSFYSFCYRLLTSIFWRTFPVARRAA